MTAIIVLNYNDWMTTTKFLKQISDYKNIDKIVVVDNCSSDNSWEKLKIFANNKIDVIKTDRNNGYAAGNNFGIRHVRENYPYIDNIIISNPDIIVSEKSISEIVSKLKCGYDMVTGLIYNFDPETREKKLASNFCWRVPKYSDLLGNHFLPIYKFRRCILKNSIYTNISEYEFQEIIETECVPGCFFAITMSSLKEIGDFDEDTFLFTEETILGWKLKNLNKKVCIVKTEEVMHAQSTSIKKSISSINKLAKYRLEGEIVYLRKYERCNKVFLFFYNILYWIAYALKQIWRVLSNLRK